MARIHMVVMAGLAFAAPLGVAGCGGDDDGTTPRDGGPGIDGHVPGRDGGPRRDGEACVPTIEICGDRIDQNCDGRETPCGDNDGDGIDACRAGDDLTRCDCDDERTDVRPPFGETPGAPELCDGRDNDCNGRIDESAACCAGCASLGDRTRADLCLPDGTCACTSNAGMAVCPEGQTCCSTGCVNLATDFQNCGFCGTACGMASDNCTAGVCRCGSGPACSFTNPCRSGSCG